MAISDGDRHDAYLRRIQPPVFHIDDAVAMLRRRAAFIAGVTLACAAMSLVYVLLASPRYLASGRIETSGAQVAGGVESQTGVMKSAAIFDKVIAREKLATDPLFGARSRGILSGSLAAIGLVPAADPHALALRQLDRSVSVTHDPGSSVVNVNVMTPDRETSARVANAVMEAYIEDASRPQTNAAPSARVPLDALETLQSRLRSAEQRYQSYRQDNGMAGLTGRPMLEKQASELSSQIATAEARVNSLRSALTQLQRARNDRDVDAIPVGMRSRTVDALRNRYATARRIEADLAETLGPRHPDLKFARSQTAEARRLLDQAVGEMVQSTAGELERARSAATKLKVRLEASTKDLSNSTDASAHLGELERDLEASRAAYQAFLLRSRDAGERQQSNDTLPRILSRALPPQERSGASSVRVLLMSTLLGLGLALSLAWLLELMGERKGNAALR